MKQCYLCSSVLVDANGNRTPYDHDEHIIPNAIGGQLKARGILCSSCGGQLGNSIDSPFSEMFQLITHRLDVKRDRLTSLSPLPAKLTLHSSGETIDVALRNSRLITKNPQYRVDHKKKMVFILGSAQVLKHYKTKAEAEIKELLGTDHGYTLQLVTDVTLHPEFAGTLSFPFTLDNAVFEAGFTKIAIEFALKSGIDIKHLSHLVNQQQRAIRFSNILIPYYPIHVAEKTFEDYRSFLDTDFLSHNLVLFSQRQVSGDKEIKQLYCFIELFGTFQYYVVLNRDYEGPNVEPITYAQRLIKQEIFTEDFSTMSIKDLSITIRELGIDWAEVDGKPLEDVRKLLEYKQVSINRYVFNYEDHVKKVVDGILMNTILLKDPKSIETIPGLLNHFYRNVETDDFHITHFRSRLIKNGKPHSIIPEISDLYRKDRKKFNAYTFYKFAALEASVNANANH